MAKKEIVSTEDNPFGAFSLLKDDTAPFGASEESIEAKDKPEVKVEKPKAKKEVIVEDEPEVDAEVETEVEEEIEEVEPIEESNGLKSVVEHFASKGILDYNAEDEFEDSDEGFEGIIDKTVNNRVEQGINGFKESLPKDAQEFLEFVQNGGNPSDFHKYYYQDGTFEGFDITDEDNQKYVVKQALLLEGYTEEEADDEITDTIDLGKLEKKAQVHLKKLQKVEKEQKDMLVQAQRTYAKEQEVARTREWDEFKKGLFDKEQIAGFKLTKKMKEEVWDYMTKSTDKKTGETEYQKDTKEKGAEARYLFAYLMKTGFDISKLEKMVQTKEVSKLRSKLGNYTDSRNKIKSGGNTTPEVTDNPFSGFKSLINQ